MARAGRSWLCPCRGGRQPGREPGCWDFVSPGNQLGEGSEGLVLPQLGFQENTP